MAPSERFFTELTEVDRFRDVIDASSYADAPGDWSIVITDVCGSTRAIEAGRYKDVNALGASSIIGVRNALPDVEVPFVFGGDGATLLVPNSRKVAVHGALCGLRRLAADAFGLELRCSMVEVAQLVERGHQVRVARFRTSPAVALAMLMGDGFTVAERWAKDPLAGAAFAVPDEPAAQVNLDGFECRWRPVRSRRGTMLALLLQVTVDGERKALVYAQLFEELEDLLGEAAGPPLTPRGLRLGGPFHDFSVEARIKSGSDRGADYQAALSQARKKALLGKALLATGASAGGFDGKAYRDELVVNCDFRKFDDMLRMVLDVSDEQCLQVEKLFRSHRARGEIAYGLHRSDEALVTCFVRSFSGDHIHFIDGSSGGYTLAAKQLKAQLAADTAAGQ